MLEQYFEKLNLNILRVLLKIPYKQTTPSIDVSHAFISVIIFSRISV